MNNSKLIKLLLGICGLLIIILSVEWLLADAPVQQSIGLGKADENNEETAEKLPELKTNKIAVESYTDMVERPLFIEGRRAVAESEQDVKQDDIGKIDDVTLYGIFSVEGTTFALFSQQNKDNKYFKKVVGEEISGWNINEIQADRVIVERAGQQQPLMLRKPKPKVAKRIKPPLRRKSKLTKKKQK